jgi:hypothetical protein
VFFAIGLLAVRGIFWWALVAPPLITPVVSDILPGLRRATAGTLAPRDDRGVPALNLALAAALILLGVAFLPWWRGHSRTAPSESSVSDAPLGVTAAVRRVAGPGARIFNAQIWGSWFELELPRNPAFVDSRIEVFPVSVWRDYQDVSLGREGWQGVLDRWQVDVVVANRKQQADLIPLIRRDPEWRLVHSDREGFVFVRAT